MKNGHQWCYGRWKTSTCHTKLGAKEGLISKPSTCTYNVATWGEVFKSFSPVCVSCIHQTSPSKMATYKSYHWHFQPRQAKVQSLKHFCEALRAHLISGLYCHMPWTTTQKAVSVLMCLQMKEASRSTGDGEEMDSWGQSSQILPTAKHWELQHLSKPHVTSRSGGF